MPWCFGSQLASYLSLGVQQLDIRCESKTKDNIFVTLVASIQYRALADEAADPFYKLSNIKEQIKAYVFDVIRASVPILELDKVFEHKTEIAKTVARQLAKVWMKSFLLHIVKEKA